MIFLDPTGILHSQPNSCSIVNQSLSTSFLHGVSVCVPIRYHLESTNKSVLLVHNATPGTITQFHDMLSNRLPTLKGKWNFTFKIFRNNIYSMPPELVQSHESAPESQFLYTWSPSYLDDSCVTLINKKTATVMSHIVQEELGSSANADLAIPNNHLHGGATSGLNDSFDFLVNHRMQSMWTQRQTIRGDGGQIYELENGNVTIRTANISLHGNFRGFLIQVEDDHSKFDVTDPKTIIEELIAKYDIPSGKLCYDVMSPGQLDIYGDLALQYAEILNF